MPAASRPALRRRATLAAFCLLAVLLAGAAGPAGSAPAAAPRGTIVFASDRSGNFEIYSIRADGSRLGQLTRNRANDTAPRFSPDGRRIVFTRTGRDIDLWLMNADGSRQRKLAPYGEDPSFSPDSRWIAYTRPGNSQANAYALVIASVADRGRRVIRGRSHTPSWSPDGRRLAFTREVGFRPNLAVVGSDGRGLRTIRRNIGGVLGWSPNGRITFSTNQGIYVVDPDGRNVRRLVGATARGFAWSPDGRRFAFLDAKEHLHVASAAGRGGRDITPKDAGRLGSPTWSPDGRWIAVEALPAGATHHDLLVVASNGSASRRVTLRVPYPYGSENRQPSWRPRGATPARLGRRPVAPLPSEAATPKSFQAAGRVQALAADGRRVAVVVGFGGGCASVEVWEAGSRRVVRPQRPCGPNDEVSGREYTEGVALAGTRVAWLHEGGGNYLETVVMTATLARPRPVWVAFETAEGGQYGTFADDPVGDGPLPAFTVEKRCDADGEPECPTGRKTGDIVEATIWRIGGQAQCPYRTQGSPGCTRVADAKGELTTLAVDAGRIAARTDTGVRLLDESGGVLRDFGVKASAAALSGTRLALRTADAVEVYDTGSGQLTARFPVARAVRLQDLEGDILVTASGGTVTLRRLGNGRTTTFRTTGTARAQLEPPGLFVAGGRRVTFTSMQDVLRRLGG